MLFDIFIYAFAALTILFGIAAALVGLPKSLLPPEQPSPPLSTPARNAEHSCACGRVDEGSGWVWPIDGQGRYPHHPNGCPWPPSPEEDPVFRLCPALEHPVMPSYCEEGRHRECEACEKDDPTPCESGIF